METLGGEFFLERLAIGKDVGLGGVVFINRADDHVLRREAGRGHKAIVIGVRHNHPANEARRDTPRGRVGKLLHTLFVLELDIAGLGKILAQVVRRASLESLAILHHRFDAQRINGAGETFALGLTALDDWHGHIVFSKVSIHLEHLMGLLDRFGLSGVDRVAFLPEELGGAQEKTRAHLPAYHVGPLVNQDGQITVGLYPLRIGLADDGLGGRADNEWLFQFAGRDELTIGARLEARVRDDGTFLGEAIHVCGFLLDIADRNEEREIGVHMARLLKHRIEVALDIFPKGVAPGLNHHTATDGGILGQVGVLDDLQVPLRIILGAGWGDGGLGLGGRLLGHNDT